MTLCLNGDACVACTIYLVPLEIDIVYLAYPLLMSYMNEKCRCPCTLCVLERWHISDLSSRVAPVFT